MGRMIAALTIAAVLAFAETRTAAQGGGGVIVRVDDTSGSHCINAETEHVTVFLRRVFTEKTVGWFTEDKRAGVLVRTQLTANGDDGNNKTVQVPSVDLVSVQDAQAGRVSLALEYAVASDFPLAQSNNITRSIDLYVNLAKAAGKTTFGTVMDLAGQALTQVSIPANPYSQIGSKMLKFANDAVDKSIKDQNADQIAHIGLQFRRGAEPDLIKCSASGNERTGAVAVLRSVGATGAQLIPVTDTEQLYCFRYSSSSTYELLAARRLQNGSCPAPGPAYQAVMNDYVMLLVSAYPAPKPGKAVTPEAQRDALTESATRCRNFGLKPEACGAN